MSYNPTNLATIPNANQQYLFTAPNGNTVKFDLSNVTNPTLRENILAALDAFSKAAQSGAPSVASNGALNSGAVANKIAGSTIFYTDDTGVYQQKSRAGCVARRHLKASKAKGTLSPWTPYQGERPPGPAGIANQIGVTIL
jgi:hypothetical protein